MPPYPMKPFLLMLAWLGIALLAQAPAYGQDTGNGQEKCFLWKVTSTTNTIYLLGSVHVASVDFYPLPAEIDDAFARSKLLVVEVNTAKIDKAKMQKLVIEKGQYPAGESLSKNLSKETMDQLRAYCVKRKIGVEQFEQYRPWMVNLTVSQIEMKISGLSGEHGIDKHFLEEAKIAEKPVRELETLEGQIELFAGRTLELQEKILAITLAETGELKGRLETMMAAWKVGDAGAMEELVLRAPLKRHPEAKLVHEKMIYPRNGQMVEKIEGYLKGSDSCFVVVGALHLVGDRGIVKMLEDRKYRVEQIGRASAKKKAQ
jgi:uncharacterized protein YbaP (TraB family)